MRKIILASSSPRRKEILNQVSVKFDIIPSLCDEVITKSNPSEIVEELASQKAEEVAKKITYDSVIIGADTIVAVNNKILGKPKNKDEAFEMVKMIQNNYHNVYTGVCLIIKSENYYKKIVFHEKTEVSLYQMTDEQIWDYISTDEPMDKAGAYAIQGKFAIYIKAINGDYNTIVGLPISKIYNTLLNENIDMKKFNTKGMTKR